MPEPAPASVALVAAAPVDHAVVAAITRAKAGWEGVPHRLKGRHSELPAGVVVALAEAIARTLHALADATERDTPASPAENGLGPAGTALMSGRAASSRRRRDRAF